MQILWFHSQTTEFSFLQPLVTIKLKSIFRKWLHLFSHNALYLVHAMFGGHDFFGFVLIVIGIMEILATFPHLQDDIKVSRRYEGWYYTKLV